MPTLSWYTKYESREPKTTRECEIEQIRELRAYLDLDYESGNYSLEELKEMVQQEKEERCAKDLDPEG